MLLHDKNDYIDSDAIVLNDEKDHSAFSNCSRTTRRLQYSQGTGLAFFTKPD